MSITLEAARAGGVGSMDDAALIVRSLLNLPAAWTNMGGNIGAVVIPVRSGRYGARVDEGREVLIGSTADVLTYSDGARRSTVEAWQVTGQYDQEHFHSEEVPVADGPRALAAAVARAYVAARNAS